MKGELKHAWEWKDEAEPSGNEIPATTNSVSTSNAAEEKSNSKSDEPKVSNGTSDGGRIDGDEGVRRRKNAETYLRS